MKYRIATFVNILLPFLTLFNCSDNDSKEANVDFRIYLHESKKITVDMFHINFSDGSQNVNLDKDDFIAVSGSTQYYTKEYSTKTTGVLLINFILSDSTSDSICFGNISLNLKSDRGWGVMLLVDHTDPFYQCMGCSGHKAFALKDNYRDSVFIPPDTDTLIYDSIYVNWGSNSISNPVVY